MTSEAPTTPYISANTRRACSNCRKRKIKCDGGRPTCGQCLRRAHLGIEECEYADISGRTQSEILEENISRLESRIHELEDPSRASSVTLHQPYMGQGQSSASASSADAAQVPQEPPDDVRRSLLSSFLPQGDNFGFFLNATRFWEATLSSLPIGHPSRPTPALLSAVYLVAHYLATRQTQDQRHQQLLSQALQEAASTLTSTHPNRVMHGIQAEVLLSTYLFDNGRILEGKYHLSTAVSLAIGAGLHQIRSQQNRSPSLPPPVDPIEEGERINAFWTVYMLSNMWGVAVGSTSSTIFDTNPSSEIDTPWPLDMSEYERASIYAWPGSVQLSDFFPFTQRGLSGNIVGSSTIRNFLAQTSTDAPGHGSHYGSSPLALSVKASVLLDRAATIASSFRANMTEAERQEFLNSFSFHEGLIDSFISSSIPPLNGLDPASPLFRIALVIHTLSYTAIIQLHSVFAERDARSMSKSLAAAEASVSLLRQARHAPLVNPIMAVLWMNAGKVLLQEIGRLRSRRARSGTPSGGDREGELHHGLQRLSETMGVFAGSSVLMRDQLSNLQQAHQRLQ
ncbi:hypothetical protein WG66_010051 [Moniliophthora roreri]|uniref:Zn(2)-C6 fungal-type domain-containing protein n=1 Tax=Moniliophthora roreri TaxID=221103 RepID=A0A0W0EYS3_MONRR|nr:hypothetical protein WG66_010051 [Moniliophthora roreri]